MHQLVHSSGVRLVRIKHRIPKRPNPVLAVGFQSPRSMGSLATLAAMRAVVSSSLAADCRRENNLHRGVLNANKGCPPFSPKFGFRILHAATTCGSISGKAFVASFRCGVPTIIGRIQSTAIPRPALAPLGTKPACEHAAAIRAQGCQGTG
jgi:hypothetical protein